MEVVMTDKDAPNHAHIYNAIEIGTPLELDLSVLNPPGMNQGVARFSKTDF